MPSYFIACSDGSDANCHGGDDYNIAIPDLNESQIEDIADRGYVTITREQLDGSGPSIRSQVIDLDEDEEYDVQVDLGGTICGACGSDQTYNAAGENISAE